jgi:Tfp pilus assembly protein FimT
MPFRNKLSGFTLFELMVTISMIVLLLTMSSVAFRNTNKRTELIFTAHQVAAMARLAESYAASAKELDNIASQNIWGLYFDKTDNQKIIMFVDVDNNQLFEPALDKVVRTLTLPRQIIVWKIFEGQGLNEQEITAPNGAVAVLFSPPDPKTKLRYFPDISNNWDSTEVVRVTLKDDNNESVKNIKFNFFGLIDVPQ